MAPHIIWAGVVLAVVWLVVRQWKTNQRLDFEQQCALGRMKRDQDFLRDEVTALQGAFTEHRNVTLDRLAKLAELEPVVKALSAVPKTQPLGRRV